MSKRKNRVRDKPVAVASEKRSAVWMGAWDDDTLACRGYVSLSKCPEISAAVDVIASLVSNMTLYQMRNTESGDVRIKDGLSRLLDISPTKTMTRKTWLEWIVRTMYLGGDGNAVCLPISNGGIIEAIQPVPPSWVSFQPEGNWDYSVLINGRRYDSSEVLHFRLHPGEDYPWLGRGVRVTLKDVAYNLRQAAETTRGFMSSKWKPSIIVKVDGLTEEFSSPDGRKRLLDSYLSTTEAGEPWMIPADQFSVEQVRPLSLNDLAIDSTIKLDKATVASIIGVPSFMVGVGDFKKDEWNNFVRTTGMSISQIIQQEETKKILYSPDRYFQFSPRTQYAYDLKDIAAMADEQYIRGIMTGNEVRDWIGLSPKEGLDDLVILENYIPLGKIGDQKKLATGGE